jgi:hypothetical protein
MLEEVQLPDQCSLEFYSPYFLWDLGASPPKGKTAERTLPDRFEPHFVFRYFCDVLHFANAPVLIHG